ncbi:TetR family transcriptional regulator [Amycolatopsis ultiminotia]|uniref:TetR family transcriptional regulator n=1 Tax=Amycolatopsis ultiminotia TaxID=543629 RepID=A0ABP6Y6C7_9PSEU
MSGESARRAELLEACYAHMLEHGLAVPLRPLAAAVGSSPRVLLYLFGSREELLRAVLAHARRWQVARMSAAAEQVVDGFEAAVTAVWDWLSAPAQRPVVRLTYEAFALSWRAEPGPWEGFARESAREWLALLVRAQPEVPVAEAEIRARRALARIRGLLLDLLAGEPADRVAAAAGGWTAG